MGEVTSFEAYRKVAGIVLQVARAGNAILVGRGAAILCQELEACRHFRLEAGLPWRAARMSRQLGLPLDDAEAQVKTRSRERERFIRECLGADIADHALYHAIFNNERLAPAEMAEAIVSLMPRGEGPRPSP
jgi:cytidylate kinase